MGIESILNSSIRSGICGLAMVLLSGCGDMQDQRDPKIKEALNLIPQLRRYFPADTLDLPERILNEPVTHGAVKEWGCVAFFKENGEVEKAYTLKTVDFPSGNKYNIRQYNAQELAEATPQILNFKKKV